MQHAEIGKVEKWKESGTLIIKLRNNHPWSFLTPLLLDIINTINNIIYIITGLYYIYYILILWYKI